MKGARNAGTQQKYVSLLLLSRYVSMAMMGRLLHLLSVDLPLHKSGVAVTDHCSLQHHIIDVRVAVSLTVCRELEIVFMSHDVY